jgi:putative addiction module CopG family antidote
MNVPLSPEEEARIAAKVKSGLYPSSAAVIQQALRLLDEQEATLQQEAARQRQAAQAILDSIQPVKARRDSVEIIREERERLNRRA